MELEKQGQRGQTLHELNGVDLDALKQTVEAITKNPKLASFKFRSRNEWLGGGYNQSVIKPFYGVGKEYAGGDRFTLEADSPEVLLGTDKAADAVEIALHSLAACLTTTIAYHAAAKGIMVKSIQSSYEGDLDLHGFLGLAEKTRKGFSEIRVNFNVETDASENEIRDLIKFSPVYEMLSAGLPVTVNFKMSKPMLS